jgi:hypothetical protein
MKHRVLKVAAILGAFLMFAAVSANAQTGPRIEANIPFDFAAGETKLKAGDYTVKRIARNSFLLSSADSKTRVIVQATTAIEQRRDGSPARLVFRRHGQEYFLAQVWTDVRANGWELNPSKTEARLAKQLKEDNTSAQTVDVLSRNR